MNIHEKSGMYFLNRRKEIILKNHCVYRMVHSTTRRWLNKKSICLSATKVSYCYLLFFFLQTLFLEKQFYHFQLGSHFKTFCFFSSLPTTLSIYFQNFRIFQSTTKILWKNLLCILYKKMFKKCYFICKTSWKILKMFAFNNSMFF